MLSVSHYVQQETDKIAQAITLLNHVPMCDYLSTQDKDILGEAANQVNIKLTHHVGEEADLLNTSLIHDFCNTHPAGGLGIDYPYDVTTARKIGRHIPLDKDVNGLNDLSITKPALAAGLVTYLIDSLHKEYFTNKRVVILGRHDILSKMFVDLNAQVTIMPKEIDLNLIEQADIILNVSQKLDAHRFKYKITAIVVDITEASNNNLPVLCHITNHDVQALKEIQLLRNIVTCSKIQDLGLLD